MRGVSKRFVRGASMLALMTLLASQGATASERDDGGNLWLRHLQRAKHFLVTILDQFSVPPG